MARQTSTARHGPACRGCHINRIAYDLALGLRIQARGEPAHLAGVGAEGAEDGPFLLPRGRQGGPARRLLQVGDR